MILTNQSKSIAANYTQMPDSSVNNKINIQRTDTSNTNQQNNINQINSNKDKKTKAIGILQLGAGVTALYKSIEHGLPRALGIRTEYHVSPKENAELIKEAGYILDPTFGGKNGMSGKFGTQIYKQKFTQNSQGYVHITGINSSSKPRLGFDCPKGLLQTINRKEQVSRYKSYSKGSKRFCIPGIDSYFDKNFIPDPDEFALKSTNKIKCYKNRLSAMIGGLKEFGLKGIKENKGRAALGAAIIIAGICASIILIKKGIEKLKSD